MPSLKAIRTRIASIKNTRKITRAMKMVSAAKLRRAQEAIIAARPYVSALTRVVSELSDVAGKDSHPLFQDRAAAHRQDRVAIIMFTSDRGLAGAFNSSVIKQVERLVNEEFVGSDISLRIIGKKANAYFIRRDRNITSFDPAATGATALQMSGDMATKIVDDFMNDRVDRVFVVYNEFKSAISQGVTFKQVLPVIPEKVPHATVGAHGEPVIDKGPDYIYEPGKQELLTKLVPLYVQIGLYRAALESIASEFGARMTAMENATKNAGEMISKYTLAYNRARQATITKELLEIIGGAEALKG